MDNYIPPISINTPPRRPLKAHTEAERLVNYEKDFYLLNSSIGK